MLVLPLPVFFHHETVPCGRLVPRLIKHGLTQDGSLVVRCGALWCVVLCGVVECFGVLCGAMWYSDVVCCASDSLLALLAPRVRPLASIPRSPPRCQGVAVLAFSFIPFSLVFWLMKMSHITVWRKGSSFCGTVSYLMVWCGAVVCCVVSAESRLYVL